MNYKKLLLAVITVLGVFLMFNTSKVRSAGGSMPTVNAIGCTLNNRRYVYVSVNSNIPVKLSISNVYSVKPYYTRSLTGSSIKQNFVIDVTSKYATIDPTISYTLHNMLIPGETDLTPLFNGNLKVENVSCSTVKPFFTALGYSTLYPIIK